MGSGDGVLLVALGNAEEVSKIALGRTAVPEAGESTQGREGSGCSAFLSQDEAGSMQDWEVAAFVLDKGMIF